MTLSVNLLRCMTSELTSWPITKNHREKHPPILNHPWLTINYKPYPWSTILTWWTPHHHHIFRGHPVLSSASPSSMGSEPNGRAWWFLSAAATNCAPLPPGSTRRKRLQSQICLISGWWFNPSTNQPTNYFKVYIWYISLGVQLSGWFIQMNDIWLVVFFLRGLPRVCPTTARSCRQCCTIFKGYLVGGSIPKWISWQL